MTLTSPAPAMTGTPTRLRRSGYVLAAVINAVLLFIAQNLLEWDILPFLTPAFDDVLPLLSVSLFVGIVVNLIYVVYDGVYVKSPTQIISLAISFAVTVRMWQVFPFDFSAYDFPWDGLTRTLLVIGMIGTVVGIIVELVKLFRAAAGPRT